jgi:hypothetical protein
MKSKIVIQEQDITIINDDYIFLTEFGKKQSMLYLCK